MASATAESNNSGYDTIVAGTGSKFTVVKEIPVIRPGHVQLPLKVDSIISVDPYSGDGGKKFIQFTIYISDGDVTTAIVEDGSKYLTTEYLEVIKTATAREGKTTYSVIKEIPIGTMTSIPVGTTVKIIYSTRGSEAFNIYVNGEIHNQVTPNNIALYLTAEYLKEIKTAGGRRKTRKYKRRHTKKRKQSRRRKN
jgi:hypothetical protein